MTERIELLMKLIPHAPPMDPADVCNLMDWPVELPVGGGDDAETEWQDSIWGRWRELPIRMRLDADIRFRRMWAEAVLANLEKAESVKGAP